MTTHEYQYKGRLRTGEHFYECKHCRIGYKRYSWLGRKKRELQRALLTWILGANTYKFMLETFLSDLRVLRPHNIGLTIRKDSLERTFSAEWIIALARLVLKQNEDMPHIDCPGAQEAPQSDMAAIFKQTRPMKLPPRGSY